MFENAKEKEEYIQDEQKLYKIHQEIDQVTKSGGVANTALYHKLVSDWFVDYKDAEYFGCQVNKIGDVLIALYHYNTIYLLGESYRTIMYAPKLMFHFVSDFHIHIDDVLMKHNDVGNGSIAMSALLRYANSHCITKITGDLSSVDHDHKSRRDHYYKKFGFYVTDKSIVRNVEV